jgi:hypothetical protein
MKTQQVHMDQLANDDREQFFALMQRFVQLGQLLPDDLADTDAEIVLAEMRSTKAKIDAMVNEYGQSVS